MASSTSIRDMIAFWIFGLANNYAYVIMLSAAKDIIENTDKLPNNNISPALNNNTCLESITSRHCDMLSTGAVLLANVLPTLIVKLTFPFFMFRIPFGFRHFCICLFQVISFVTVAFSSNIYFSLAGVALASLATGLGEICYLSLTAHYSKNAISMWSSGTGGAGVFGAAAYAILTEPNLLNVEPRNALLSMLIVPFVFLITYWFILTPSPSIHRIKLFDSNTWLVPKNFSANNHNKSDSNESVNEENQKAQCKYFINSENLKIQNKSSEKFKDKLLLITPLLRYMIPLGLVYFAEYLINQGIVGLIQFDCAKGLGLSLVSQYRWYQVLYQVGVFVSRSSVYFVELSPFALFILPVFQTLNVALFYFQILYMYLPHILIVFSIILVEGIFGGAAYVNTFNRIHKEAPPAIREFSLSVASLGDSIGILSAGMAAIPLHNYICKLPMYESSKIL